MILEYIVYGVIFLYVAVMTYIPLRFGYDLAKNGFIKYAILSFICALTIPVVFVYLAGNPSDWLLM